MATLKDVAHTAGVHPTTASSVLNPTAGNSRFSPETKRRVMQAAKQLGYAPNRAASSLRTRRSATVGLVAGNIQNPFFAALSVQLEKHLRAAGYDLVLTCHGADSAKDETQLARTLVGRAVDGLLIWSEQRNGRTASLSSHPGIPRVWMGHGPRQDPTVRVDIADGLRLAVAHLRGLGCRRIAYYAPTYAQTAGLPKNRPAIMAGVCAELGLPPPVLFFFPDESWNLRAAAAFARDQIPVARKQGIDGILGYNDISAVGWQIAGQDAGMSIPVVGFDGSPLIKAWRPRLAHVDLDLDRLARTAVELLGDLMQGRPPGNRRPHIAPAFIDGAD